MSILQTINNLLNKTRSQSGFTLIELMVTIAIIGILAAVALPSYQSSVMKSRRVTAQTALLDMASREERYYTLQNTYTASLSDLYAAGANYTAGASTVMASDSSNYYYDVSIVAATSTCGITTCYSLQAVPKAGSSQAADTVCGTFTYKSTGEKGITGGTGPVGQCWRS